MSTKAQEKFAKLCNAQGGVVNYEVFTQFALYDEEFGYYKKKKTRVGKERQADFYTAQNVGSGVLRKLIIAAIGEILKGQNLSDFSFVEIGVEPGGGLLMPDEPHPFKDYRAFGNTDEVDIPERAIVYSNELFDAQPLRRFIVKDGIWRERAVTADLQEILLEGEADWLPFDMPEGYELDLSLAADDLMKSLCHGTWKGLFLAFDYGKSWEGLLQDCPQGTARTYSQHKQGKNLLENIGNQDITAHVCWDCLEHILMEEGFSKITLERQEAFLVKHATAVIEEIVTEGGPQVGAVKELVYGGDMGSKFQVLWGLR